MKNTYLQVIFLAILTAFAVISCNNQSNQLLPEKEAGKVSEIPPDTLISVNSSETLGQWYSLVISADGEVVFTPTKYGGYGEPKVPQGIPIKSRISREQLEEIIREFENQKFFSLNETYIMREKECQGVVLDAGVKTVSIEINKRKKSVRWGGCKKNGNDFPPQFFAVFYKIQEIANTK